MILPKLESLAYNWLVEDKMHRQIFTLVEAVYFVA